MRTIPFKVVCLVGMNHDAFPREQPVLPFDLMARNPRRGDRSRRNDDKYLFLESILSARRRLYISYVGQGIQDNSPRPPSVLVSELIDTLNQMAARPGWSRSTACSRFRAPTSSAVRRLQLFGRPAACSGGVRGTTRTRFPPGPADKSEDAALARGHRDGHVFLQPGPFLVKPPGIRLEKEAAVLDESEPFALDPLSAYRLGQTMLQHRLAGSAPMELLEVFRAAGDLPHDRVGDYLFARLSADVDEFAARVRDLLPPAAPEAVDVTQEIGGFHVTGRLTGLCVQGCVQMRYAGIKAKDFLTIWLQHLLLCLAAPVCRTGAAC
jgi:exodeoxyribonuclease V gamma subunit